MSPRKSRLLSSPADRGGPPIWTAILLLLAIAGGARGAAVGLPELRAATLRGFQNYVTSADLRNGESLRTGAYLWIDGLSKEARKEAQTTLQQGGVAVKQLHGKDPDIPGGMIHDWQGIVFIPGARLDEVLAFLQDYNNHATYYAPDVERARIESRDGDHFQVFMRFRRHKVVTVVLNTEQDITYFHDSPTRAHSRSKAIRIREVADPGTASEKEKSPDQENGFLWQMDTWWRMEERDGGVYVQNEAITLTRDIPTGLGWLIGPFVTSIPKETLEFTLGATRRGVLAREKH